MPPVGDGSKTRLGDEHWAHQTLFAGAVSDDDLSEQSIGERHTLYLPL